MQYICQQELEDEDFILIRKYNVLEKFHSQYYRLDHGFVREMEGKGKEALTQLQRAMIIINHY